jgi:integrase
MVHTGGFTPWSEEDLAQFEAVYPVGTKPRLAMALMLYLGVRRSDVVRIGPGHIKGGVLQDYLPKKGEQTGGNLINVPVHPELAKIIAGTPVTGTRTFLVTSFGKPFTANGFGNWMRDRLNEAKLNGDPAPNHGLRKLCCVRLAEAGCTAPEIAAITGHKDIREVQLYIEAANRKKMARTAMDKQVAADVVSIKSRTEIC